MESLLAIMLLNFNVAPTPGDDRARPFHRRSGPACPKTWSRLMGIVQLAESQGATHAKTTETARIAAILRDFQADLDAGLNIDRAGRKAGIGPATSDRRKARMETKII
jgi:hypothetical protein